jgi:hypothetical protein
MIHDVVPGVAVRRHIERLQPQRVRPDHADVVKLAAHAFQIADAVTVGSENVAGCS